MAIGCGYFGKLLARSAALVLSLVLLMVPGLHAQTLNVAVGDWPPYISRDLPFHGLIPHITSEALATQGIQVKFHFMDWQSAYELTRDGRMDASVGWIKNEARQKEVLFSKPVSYSTTTFFHSKKLAFTWDEIADLKRFRIGVVRGYSYGDEFDQAHANGALMVEVFATEELAFAALLAGQIDLLPAEDKVGETLLTQFPAAQAQTITMDEHPLKNPSLHWIASMSDPKSEALLERFNQGLAELKASGRYQKIVANLELVNQLAKLKFTTEDNAPLNYAVNGVASGVSVAVVTEILRNLESDVRARNIEVLPWARAYKSLQNEPDHVLFSMVQTPERMPQFQWVGPIYHTNVVLFARKDSGLQGSSLRDFASRMICAVREDVGAQILEVRRHALQHTHLVPHAKHCASMLALGRVELWAFGRDTGAWHIRHNGLSPDDFVEVLQLQESYRYIAFSQGVAPAIITAFQNELEFLRLSGRLDQVIKEALQATLTATPAP